MESVYTEDQYFKPDYNILIVERVQTTNELEMLLRRVDGSPSYLGDACGTGWKFLWELSPVLTETGLDPLIDVLSRHFYQYQTTPIVSIKTD